MFQFRGAWNFVFGGAKPTKAPRGDGTGLKSSAVHVGVKTLHKYKIQ